MLQVTLLESKSPISVCSSLSLAIEGVCSELALARWFRFSRGRVAHDCSGDFTHICAMHCLNKASIQAV